MSSGNPTTKKEKKKKTKLNKAKNIKTKQQNY